MPRPYARMHPREYVPWCNMLSRCNNPKNKTFQYYGGRGIMVCQSFLDFDVFLTVLGPRPVGTSLDRIDNNGHYEPGNVRWADKPTQMSNRSDNRLLTHRGKTQTLSQWSSDTGLSVGCIWNRLENCGWSVKEALEIPVLKPSEVGRIGAASRWHRNGSSCEVSQ